MKVDSQGDGGRRTRPRVADSTQCEIPWGALARVLPDNLTREEDAADVYRLLLTALVGRRHLTLHQAAELEEMGRTDGVARAILGLADHLVERLEAR